MRQMKKHAIHTDKISGRVVYIMDGDTVLLRVHSQARSNCFQCPLFAMIRLRTVFEPSLHARRGRVARTDLAGSIRGELVDVEVFSIRYGRFVAEISTKGRRRRQRGDPTRPRAGDVWRRKYAKPGVTS